VCSYNAVNGVPSCANDWLLGTLLRESWQFDGYVTSDCDADSDVFNSHHYTETASEAVAVILKAGTDVDCGGFMGGNAAQALKDGTIVEGDIDTVLKRLFRVRLRLGVRHGQGRSELNAPLCARARPLSLPCPACALPYPLCPPPPTPPPPHTHCPTATPPPPHTHAHANVAL
jgi:beta-glucosidase-like glycosyl hydrolase